MNQINIIGTITKEIELQYAPSGTAIAKFSIAYNEKYKKQNGEQVEKAHFFDVVTIGKKAEVLQKFFSRGKRIGITGSLNFVQWQNKEGANRSKVSIKLNDFTFIDKPADITPHEQQKVNGYQPQDDELDEVPF